jgi:RES domain-containing protein
LIVRSFRITQTKHAPMAFTGEGAKRFGGRWNSVGTRMVYTASSLSLATLEMLVHLEEISTIVDYYTVIPLTFDRSLLQIIDPASLPKGWDRPEPIPATQILGDKWIAEASGVALQVPSAVTPGEVNYLLNPFHSSFRKISFEPAFDFKLDKRLRPGD